MKETTLLALAMAAALGLLGVVGLAIVTTPQEAEANRTIGLCASALKNSSAMLCHNLG